MYDQAGELNKGSQVNSNFHSIKTPSFGVGGRMRLTQRFQTPGPGSYRPPSDFGYVDIIQFRQQKDARILKAYGQKKSIQNSSIIGTDMNKSSLTAPHTMTQSPITPALYEMPVKKNTLMINHDTIPEFQSENTKKQLRIQSPRGLQATILGAPRTPQKVSYSSLNFDLLFFQFAAYRQPQIPGSPVRLQMLAKTQQHFNKRHSSIQNVY